MSECAPRAPAVAATPRASRITVAHRATRCYCDFYGAVDGRRSVHRDGVRRRHYAAAATAFPALAVGCRQQPATVPSGIDNGWEKSNAASPERIRFDRLPARRNPRRCGRHCPTRDGRPNRGPPRACGPDRHARIVVRVAAALYAPASRGAVTEDGRRGAFARDLDAGRAGFARCGPAWLGSAALAARIGSAPFASAICRLRDGASHVAGGRDRGRAGARRLSASGFGYNRNQP